MMSNGAPCLVVLNKMKWAWSLADAYDISARVMTKSLCKISKTLASSGVMDGLSSNRRVDFTTKKFFVGNDCV